MTLEPGLCQKCDGPALHTPQEGSTRVSCSLCGDYQVENEPSLRPPTELQPIGSTSAMVDEPVSARAVPKELPNQADTMELHPDPMVFQLSQELAAQLPQAGLKERENLIQKAFEFFLAYCSELERPMTERADLSDPADVSTRLTKLQRQRLTEFAQSQNCSEAEVLGSSLQLYLNEKPE